MPAIGGDGQKREVIMKLAADSFAHDAYFEDSSELLRPMSRGGESRTPRRWTPVDVNASPLAEQVDSNGRVLVIGSSAPWRDVMTKARQVAATETTVLLQGESGTGKEVVARLIHRTSPRRNRAFVAINCAALPDQLLESELFGYERGAFTGALQAKPGQIEVASGGVLFLDEVGELSPAAQAKLLRVLQEREFQRLGGTRTLKADVRVVAATNRDLGEMVDRGQVPRGPLLPTGRLRDPHPTPARAQGGSARARRRVPEGHQPVAAGSGRAPDRGRDVGARGARLARQRARTAQRARAGRDPQSRLPDRH